MNDVLKKGDLVYVEFSGMQGNIIEGRNGLGLICERVDSTERTVAGLFSIIKYVIYWLDEERRQYSTSSWQGSKYSEEAVLQWRENYLKYYVEGSNDNPKI